MLRDNDRINGLGLSVLIVVTIWEVGGLTTFPRRAAQEVGPDAWLSVIVAAIVAIVMVAVVTKLSLRFPEQTFVEYAPRIVGSWLGRAIGLAALAVWILIAARVSRQVGDLVKTVFLDRTPLEIILLVLLLAAAYLSRHGVEPIVRVAQIIILTTPLSFGLFALALVEARPENLLPVLSNGPLPVLRAGVAAVSQFEGFELPLMLIPFLRALRHATKAGVAALAVVGFSAVLVMVTVQSVFGAQDASEVLWSGALVVQAVELPGFFLERLSTLFIALWIGLTLPTISVHLFLAALSLSRLTGLSEQKPFVLPLLPLVLALALTPANLQQVEAFDKGIALLGQLVFVVVPPLLLIVASFRRLDDRKKNGGVPDAG